MEQRYRQLVLATMALLCVAIALPAEAANKPPKLTGTLPAAMATEGRLLTYTVRAFTDPEGGPITYSASGNPSWLAFNPSARVFSGIPPYSVTVPKKVKKYTIKVYATDSGGKRGSKSFSLKVSDAVELPPSPPAVQVPLADLKLDEDVPYWFELPPATFSNPAGGTMTYSFTGLPAGSEVYPVELGAIGFKFSYGPPQAAVGTHTVTVTAVNRYGLSVSDQFTLTVANKNDPPEPGIAPFTVAVVEEQPVNFVLPAGAIVDEDGDELTYSVFGANGPFTIDQSTLEIRGMVLEPQHSNSLSVKAEDPTGLIAVIRISLDVTPVNDPPRVRFAASDRLVNVGEGFMISPMFEDPDDALLAITIVGAPEWASVSDGRVMAPAETTQGGTWTIEFTATDPHGLSVTDTVVLTVLTDNHAPIVARPFHPTPGVQGQLYSYTFAADAFEDPDGDELEYTLRSPPPWLTLDSATRTLSGTPPVDGPTWANVNFVATDPQGASAHYTSGFETRAAGTPPASFTVNGRIQAQQGAAVDGDTNDPASPWRMNNAPAQAQAVGSTPAVISGFASSVGTGVATDRFRFQGDEWDTYRIALRAGEVIYLQISDHVGAPSAAADLDLYLEDAATETLIAWSAGFGPGELLTVPLDGEYNVVVHGFNGGSNYVLNIGGVGGMAAASFMAITSADAFVPGEAIVRRHPASGTSKHGRLAYAPAPELVKLGGVGVNGKPGNPELGAWRGRPIADQAMRTSLETVRAAKQMAREPGIASVDLNLIRKPTATPTDPLYPQQWHYRAINLPSAWNSTRGVDNVVVAIIDTGVMLTHPDLAPNLVAGYDFISSAARSRDGDGIDANPDDPGDGGFLAASSYHGTHVAGTVAAVVDNGIGVSGVAPGVKLMPLRVLGVGGGTSHDVIQAVRFAAGLTNSSGTTPVRRADVINLSLGGGGYSSAEQETYAAARAAGSIVIAAAGNEASVLPSYPAAYDGVVSVSATDLRHDIAPYSNFGPTIDLAAPGGDLAEDADGDGFGDGVLSTHVIVNGGVRVASYARLQGTSMAAPHAAGVAALMRSVHPGLTPAMFDDEMRTGRITDDLGGDGESMRNDSFGFGLINAQKAVLRAYALANGEVRPTVVLVTPSSITMPPAINEATILVQRDGPALARLTSVMTSDPRVSVAAFGIDAFGFGGFRVAIDRTGLPGGVHPFTVDFASDLAGSGRLQLFVEVPLAVAPAYDNGMHYVLLVDAESFEVVAQTSTLATDSIYEYSIEGVPPGAYLLVAGTDHDNDFSICDPGESCAGYPTLTQLELLEVVDHDLEVPVISTAVLQAVNGSTSSPAVESRTPTGILRLVPKP